METGNNRPAPHTLPTGANSAPTPFLARDHSPHYTLPTGANGNLKNAVACFASRRSKAFIVLCLLAAACTTTAAPARYALATAHPYATEAGMETLEAGGNAFDAAVAVTAMLAVIEPYSSGLGGGGFWLLHIAEDKKSILLDAREKAPRAAHRDMYLDDSGKVIPGLSVDGPLAAAVPGVPAALAYLAENYGRLPLSTTLRPAIEAAQEGFPANEKLIRMLEKRRDAVSRWPSSREIFLHDGNVPKPGHVIRQPELAEVLRRIATEGKNGFYRGEIADRLVLGIAAAGGIWQRGDLADYEVVLRLPVRFTYRNAEIVSAAPPSSGGVVMAEIFNILSQFDLESVSPAEATHYLVEAMRLAYRDRAKYLGDPDFVDMPITKLTGREYARQLAETIGKKRARTDDEEGRSAVRESPDTTHYSIIDAEGNRVAATLSINYSFGSGFVPPGTGVLLNNEMDDFAAKPGAPNLYGLVGGKANSIEPGKRMLSSMAPTFIDDGRRLAILGTPGGSRIITMVTLAVLDFLEGADAAAIVTRKRFHHQYLPDAVQYEPGAFDPSLIRQLHARGHRLKPLESDYGNMQIVIHDRANDTLDAAADPRGIGSVRIR